MCSNGYYEAVGSSSVRGSTTMRSEKNKMYVALPFI